MRLSPCFAAACLLAQLNAPAGGAALPDAPAAAEIAQVRSDKVIYKPGETATFSVTYSSKNGGAAALQLWVERELDPPFKAAEVALKQAPGAQQQATLVWTPDKDVFGHRAVARLVDAQGSALAEASTLFDVTAEWQHVVRLVSIGANAIATAKFGDAQIEQLIQRLRSANLNAFQAWTFAPEPYQLAPAAESWPYQYGKPGDGPIVKERLLSWSKALHRNGLKFIGYDEVSAIAGPPEWRIFAPNDKSGKAIAPYFSERGMFRPNSLAAAPRFTSQLQQSVRMFGWDGILLDSAIASHISTSEGVDATGKKITALTPGEVGFRYLAEAREQARRANPDFRVFAQNATSVSVSAVKEPLDRIYAAVTNNAQRLNIREYSKAVDIYTAEIDAFNEPRDGRYPLSYDTMSVSLNSLVEVLGKPLLAWAFLTPPGTEKSIAFVRPYMAIHLASRTHVHDHFSFYGGAASGGPRSPATEQFVRYNTFLARFSQYLHDPQLRWVTDAANRFSITAPKPLFWERTVYRRALPAGGERIVINVLNLPSNGKILNQTEIPKPAQELTLKFKQEIQPTSVTWLDADDPSLKPTVLQRTPGAAGMAEYRLPALASWGVVVIESRK